MDLLWPDRLGIGQSVFITIIRFVITVPITAALFLIAMGSWTSDHFGWRKKDKSQLQKL